MQHVFVLYMMLHACKIVLIMFIMVFPGFVMKSTAIYYICIVLVWACACDTHFLHHASEKHIFYIMYDMIMSFMVDISRRPIKKTPQKKKHHFLDCLLFFNTMGCCCCF